MRLTGFVNVAGSRERIDWTITSSGIISGAGLSADEVNLSIPLPETIPQTDELIDDVQYEDNYYDMTVVDLRLLLQERDQPIYGNKDDLVARLREWDASNPSTGDVGVDVEEVVVIEETETEGADDGVEGE